MKRFVYSPRTLKPSGTPLCSSLTRPQKPCSLTSLQPLSSPQSLTCSSQVPCRLKTFSWLCSESPETERFVGKLRRAGSLADFCCMPGNCKSLYANCCFHLFDLFSWNQFLMHRYWTWPLLWRLPWMSSKIPWTLQASHWQISIGINIAVKKYNKYIHWDRSNASSLVHQSARQYRYLSVEV